VPKQREGGGQPGRHCDREGPAEWLIDDHGDHDGGDRGGEHASGDCYGSLVVDRAGHLGAEAVGLRGGHALAAGPGQREPAGDGRGNEGGGTAAVAFRLGLRERGDLDEQGKHERDDAEGADVRLSHDGERFGGRPGAAQAVGQVG
jgi:hypothetical protein